MKTLVRIVGALGCAGLASATMQTGVTTRASVDSLGNQGNWHSSVPSLSADGRLVAFSSVATNLVAGDMNTKDDVFVHDRLTGATTRVCLGPSGNEGNGGSRHARLSADGRFVAFESSASNISPGDTNAVMDAFVRDLTTNVTIRVSVNSGGTQGDDVSRSPAISGDGHAVAFESEATNLVASDTNGIADVFLRDRSTNQTLRLSVDAGGNEANGPSRNPSISADGLVIAFESAASNLVPGDDNGAWDVFVRDLGTGQTERVSTDSNGDEANAGSLLPCLSADGRWIAFESLATNLVSGDTNGSHDVFVHDRRTGETARVSVSSQGAQGDFASYSASVSGDGRWVAFESYATNLVPGDVEGWPDVFVHDRASGETFRVDVSSSGAPGSLASSSPSLSLDGRCIAFDSFVATLVPGDTNGVKDVFVRERWLDARGSK